MKEKLTLREKWYEFWIDIIIKLIFRKARVKTPKCNKKVVSGFPKIEKDG